MIGSKSAYARHRECSPSLITKFVESGKCPVLPDGKIDFDAADEALAKNLGLSKATRFINVLEVGPARVLEGARDSGYKKGYEISFELPIFDWGGAKVAKAEAIYMQAVERAAEAATTARSEVRESYHAYRTHYDIARHYRDEIVPLHKRISEENVLRYNGMVTDDCPRLVPGDIETPDPKELAAYITAMAGSGLLSTPDDDLENYLRGIMRMPEKPEGDMARPNPRQATGPADSEMPETPPAKDDEGEMDYEE